MFFRFEVTGYKFCGTVPDGTSYCNEHALVEHAEAVASDHARVIVFDNQEDKTYEILDVREVKDVAHMIMNR